MKNLIKTTLVLVLGLANSCLFGIEDRTSDNPSLNINSSFLSWTQRTPEINTHIEKWFSKLVNNQESSWGRFNGQEIYGLLSIHDHKLVKAIIQNASPSQTEFYFMDLGAGNFQWGRSLAKFLNNQSDIPDNITFHIIGIRGENNLSEEVNQDGNCFIYEFGRFKIENLEAEFEARGLFLNNKVDLITSHYVYRHLVDPLTTYIQAYNLLTPFSGYMISDGLKFLVDFDYNGGTVGDHDQTYKGNMAYMLKMANIPFIMTHTTDVKELNTFLVLKKDKEPLELPLRHGQYISAGLDPHLDSTGEINFKTITKNMPDFHLEAGSLHRLFSECRSVSRSHNTFFGSRKIYEWIKQHDLFDYFFSKPEWDPIIYFDILDTTLSPTIELLKDDL